jgi:hypothetical protein
MLSIGAAGTIRGVASAATAITYTLLGDEVSAGADAFKVLAQGQLPSSIATLYTVPGSTMALVKSIHLANPTGTARTAQLNVNGTAGTNVILPPTTIPAGGFAVYDGRWTFYNSQGQALGVGATGPQGDAGAPGADGADGADGVGVPAGGTMGQRLAKASGTDHDTEWVDPGGGVVALNDLSDVDLTGQADGDFLQRVSGVWVPVDAPTGGGGDLYGIGPADRPPGSPDADDDEFDTTDTSDPMTGWTTLGTPTAHDIDSTLVHHYYVRKAAGGISLTGIYKARTVPFTVTAKMSGNNVNNVQARAGIFVAQATPGKLLTLSRAQGPATLQGDVWTNPTTFASSTTGLTIHSPHIYLRMIVASSTNVTLQASSDGVSWFTIASAVNPAMTIGAAGLCIDPGSAGDAIAATYDWIRFS